MATSSGECVINELQQVQLRAQILVYGALLQGSLPEEPLMVGAFSDTSPQEPCWNEGRNIWERAWLTASEKAKGSTEPASQFPLLEAVKAPAPAPAQTMPTATRSALTIQPPSSSPRAGEADAQPDTRDKKRSKLSSGDNDEELEKNLHKQELEVLQVKQCVDEVDMVTSSILEHSKSLRLLLQGRAHEQGPMASLRIALEAAYSAANAAAAATRASYDSALQAQRTSIDISEGVTSQDEEPECEDVARAIGVVFKAVSQAQTALNIGSSFSKRRHQNGNKNNSPQEALLSEEGATVEIMSRGPGIWLTAKVLSVKEGTAHVLYTELVEDGNNPVTEWVSTELRACHPPRVRLPYPTFDLNEKLDDEPKRWTVGDHIDARVEHSWREGIIVCVNNEELEVFYPDDGAIASVKSSNIRPSLLWQGDQWVLWKCLHVEAHENNKLSNTVDKSKGAAAAIFSPEIVAELGETGPLPNHKMRKLVDVILEETESQRKRDEKRVKNPIHTKVNKAKQLIERATKSNSNSSIQSKLALAKGQQMLRQFVRLKRSSTPRKPKQKRKP